MNFRIKQENRHQVITMPKDCTAAHQLNLAKTTKQQDR
jgi:hypothetical protein